MKKLVVLFLGILFLASLIFGLLRDNSVEVRETKAHGSILCLSCIGVE